MRQDTITKSEITKSTITKSTIKASSIKRGAIRKRPSVKRGLMLCGVSLGLLFAVTACVHNPYQQAAAEVPVWLNNPVQGVVASCGFNIQGHHHQKQCAIQRAREQLAAEQGVNISSTAELTERVANGRERISLIKTTASKVTSTVIQARVKEAYYDAQRDEYYVWMVRH